MVQKFHYRLCDSSLSKLAYIFSLNLQSSWGMWFRSHAVQGKLNHLLAIQWNQCHVHSVGLLWIKAAVTVCVYIYDDFSNIFAFGFIYLDPDVVACLFVGKGLLMWTCTHGAAIFWLFCRLIAFNSWILQSVTFRFIHSWIKGIWK